MNALRYLLLLFYILSIFSCGLYAKGKSLKPNISIIFCDDPGETINRTEEYIEIVKELLADIEAHTKAATVESNYFDKE